MGHEDAEFEFTGSVFPITVSSPISVIFSRDTGSLAIRHIQMHPAVIGGASFEFRFSQGATRELAIALKHLEAELGMPIEDLAKPDAAQ